MRTDPNMMSNAQMPLRQAGVDPRDRDERNPLQMQFHQLLFRLQVLLWERMSLSWL